MKGVKIGQIQWLLFWMVIVDWKFLVVWLISLLFEDKDLEM
jgi:hypothetical protein